MPETPDWRPRAILRDIAIWILIFGGLILMVALVAPYWPLS